MREWRRVGGDTKCGCCGLRFKAQTPMLLLSGTTWRKWRCQTCAGEPVPDHIPSAAETTLSQQSIHDSMTRIAALRGSLPFDVKATQAGERE